ncbi:MAG: hypothetical protein HRU18_28165 [Pseudoalteromonas sp.]|uniref:hypothetical protein n=1 Tax=Pseudoalteromonas sp. TaxID=53249 RepID=UPI001DCD41C0|nr:hypothetical protein [Pseudoalteromonas sp.]NRA82087.1 hypothetical protein [Pseudoalteromonas sp.]
MPRRFGFGLGFNTSRLSGLPAPSGFVAKYQAYDVNDFTLVTGSNVSQWDDRTTQTFGSELVTNSDFNTDSDWIKGAGWTISGGTAEYSGNNGTSAIQQPNINTPIGNKYLITIDVVYNEGLGTNPIDIAGIRVSDTHLDIGTHEFIYTPVISSGTLLIYARDGERFEIDNISVKEILTGANHLTQGTSTSQPVLNQAYSNLGDEEVTNGDFDTDLTGWNTIFWFWESGKAKLIGDGSVQGLSQSNIFEIGKIYLVEFNIESTGGNVGIQNAANQVIPELSGNTGRVSAIWKADRTDINFKRATGAVTATLDNISVKEVLAPDFNNKVDFGANDFMEGLPPQSGDFTYVFKGLITGDRSSARRLFDATSNFKILASGTINILTDASNIITFGNIGSQTIFDSLVLKRQGTTLSLYIDSALLGSNTSSDAISFGRVGSTPSINGSLQELYVYDRALTQSEIRRFQ